MLFRSLLSFALLQYVVAVPPNDRCIAATTLEEGVPVDGDNSDANFDYNSQGVCGSRSDRRAVWYQIFGSGKDVTVSVCTNNEAITDFGIFFNCNDQLCLGEPGQQDVASNCADGEAVSYTFLGEEGENYFVHVRADWVDGVASMFTIVYTEPEDEDGSGDPVSTDESAAPAPRLTVLSAASGVSFLVTLGVTSLAAFWL